MTTPDILENLKKTTDEVCGWESLPFLTEEDLEKIEEVEAKTTNPRRDYVGTEYILLNKEDNRYFLLEVYGDDMYMEIYQFQEVSKKVEMKEVVSWVTVKNTH